MKKLIITFLVFGFSILAVSAVQAETAIFFSPTNLTVDNEENFSWPIFASSTDYIYQVGFFLQYDSDLLKLTSFSLTNSFLASSSTSTACSVLPAPLVKTASGTAVISFSRAGHNCIGVAGGGELVRLNFTARDQVGTSSLSFATTTVKILDHIPPPAATTTNALWSSGSITINDTIPPVLTLVGSSTVEIVVGEDYTEAGAIAIDNNDGDLSNQIIIDNPVSTSTPGTYIIVYNVADAAGNQASTTRQVIVLATTTISNVQAADITSNSAVISWTTDWPTTSQVEYGTSQAYGNLSALDQTLTTSHSVTLTGLAANTTYHYRVIANSASTTEATSTDYTFTTQNNNNGGGGGGGGGGGFYSPPAATVNGQADIFQAQTEEITSQRDPEKISLHWRNPVDNNYEKTIIIRTTKPIDSSLNYEELTKLGQIIYSGQAKTFLDNNINPNLDYYYAFFAVDKNNNYSEPVIIEKKASPLAEKSQNTAKTASTSQNQLKPTLTYSTLAHLPSPIVETISRQEAETVYRFNQFVNLNEITRRLYLLIINQAKKPLTDAEKYALAFFIHNGTPTTYRLGAGERAGVLNSYLSAFAKLPRQEAEWQDVIKIANGRWPTERRPQAEAEAEKTYFQKIYLRPPNMADPHDNAAVTIITYGLRPADRNLASESAAISIFKSIFKNLPTTARDWDIVRAIAYSGAIR